MHHDFSLTHRVTHHLYSLPSILTGIIAGGTKAIQSSIEGAEDSVEDGIAAIIDKDVCDKDVVVGKCRQTVSASPDSYQQTINHWFI